VPTIVSCTWPKAPARVREMPVLSATPEGAPTRFSFLTATFVDASLTFINARSAFFDAFGLLAGLVFAALASMGFSHEESAEHTAVVHAFGADAGTDAPVVAPAGAAASASTRKHPSASATGRGKEARW